MRCFPTLLLSWLILLVLVPSQAAEGQYPLGGKCRRDSQCAEGLECAYGACINKECLAREFGDMTHQFDVQAYREMILKEAGITARELYETSRQYQNDNKFSQSAPAQALINVINAHSLEISL